MDNVNHETRGIEEVINLYSDLLIRIAFTYMKNIYDTEDMVQDAFMIFMKKEPVFDNEDHEKAWFIRVTINLCKNRLKSAWFRKTDPLGEQDLTFTTFTGEENEVLTVVHELPMKYKNIILLYYYEGYSIKEIASILKRKEATVSSWLFRARKQLEIMLKEDFN